jgi:CRISPR system Cascade subunit CasE
MTLYLSRLTLKRDPASNALKALIDPPEADRRADAHHRLLWTAFSDNENRKRDFLWRAEPRGRFFALSHRQPQPHGLFEEPEVKAFEPVLSVGDKLAFVLRANAVTQRPKDSNDRSKSGRVRSHKVDVAMHLLKDVPRRSSDLAPNELSERAKKRHDIAAEAAKAWLERQGADHGFSPSPDRFVLAGYSTVTLPGYRGTRKKEPRFGIFDMKGDIVVTDPAAFVSKLASGFGRAKAYGCGLMMIRRA